MSDRERNQDSPASVVIVVEDLPVPFDRRVWQEATSLSRAGYDVTVICPRGLGHDADFEELEGVHIRRYYLPPVKSSWRGYVREYAAALAAERRLLRQVWHDRGIDLIHLCNPPDVLFLPAVWYKLVHKARVVFDHHDRSPELYVAKFRKRGFFHTALVAAQRTTFALADVVIAPNETHAELAMSRGKKDSGSVFIVRSSPTAVPEMVGSSPLQPHDENVSRIGYLGVMGEQDGVDILLGAAHHLTTCCGRSGVRFVLIGGGPAFDSLVALRNALGLGDCVDFVGYRARHEVVQLLSACDVCVCPDPKNPYNDGCTMNKVLEYMQLGKPIVQFDLVESRRLTGDAAVYAKDNRPESLADGILTLVDDRDLAERIGQAARERFRDFEWAAQEANLRAAYQQALAPSR